MVNYGGLSGEDQAISRAALNTRAVSLTGFNLGRGLAKRTTGQVRALYGEKRNQMLIAAGKNLIELRAKTERCQ